jgi:hypothetical protein
VQRRARTVQGNRLSSQTSPKRSRSAEITEGDGDSSTAPRRKNLPKAIPVAAEPRIRQTAIAATRLFTHEAYWDGCSDELLFTMVLTVSVGIQGALDGVEKC